MSNHTRPTLLAITSGRLAPGIWHSPSIPDDIAEQVDQIGWCLLDLDLHAVTDKTTLLAALGQAGRFPGSFGQNWDATLDCLQDLSWSPASGYLLCVRQSDQFARLQPRMTSTLLDVLQDAIDFWTLAGVPFHVLWQTSKLAKDANGEATRPHAFLPNEQAGVGTVHEWPTPTT